MESVEKQIKIIENEISRFINPHMSMFSKPGTVRLYERGKSVEDFTISYLKVTRNLVGEPVYNFTIEPAELNGIAGFLFKKKHKHATTHIWCEEMPESYGLKDINHKEVVVLHFNCDLVYYLSGKRRYGEKVNGTKE